MSSSPDARPAQPSLSLIQRFWDRSLDHYPDTCCRPPGYPPRRTLHHPESGSHAYPGLSYHLARTPGGITRPAPCFGEHNDLVPREILGLGGGHVANLKRTGAVTDGRQDALLHPQPTSKGTR